MTHDNVPREFPFRSRDCATSHSRGISQDVYLNDDERKTYTLSLVFRPRLAFARRGERARRLTVGLTIRKIRNTVRRIIITFFFFFVPLLSPIYVWLLLPSLPFFSPLLFLLFQFRKRYSMTRERVLTVPAIVCQPPFVRVQLSLLNAPMPLREKRVSLDRHARERDNGKIRRVYEEKRYRRSRADRSSVAQIV